MISWYMLAMSDSTCYVQHLIVESVLLLSWGVLQPSFDGLPYLSPQVNLPCRMWVLMGPLQTKSKWYSLGAWHGSSRSAASSPLPTFHGDRGEEAVQTWLRVCGVCS